MVTMQELMLGMSPQSVFPQGLDAEGYGLLGGLKAIQPFMLPTDRPTSPWAAIAATAMGAAGGLEQYRARQVQDYKTLSDLQTAGLANQLQQMNVQGWQRYLADEGATPKQSPYAQAPATASAPPAAGPALIRPQPGQTVTPAVPVTASPLPAVAAEGSDPAAATGAPGAAVSPNPQDRYEALAPRINGYESAGDWRAQPKYAAANPRSSARGAGQFIESTWLDLVKRNLPQFVQGMSDEEILKLRFEPGMANWGTAQYARENDAALRRMGINAGDSDLYLAHFLGPGDAAKIMQADPNTPIKNLLEPGVISANSAKDKNGRVIIDGNTTAGRLREIVAQRVGLEPGANIAAGTAPAGYARAQPPAGTGAPGQGVTVPVADRTGGIVTPRATAPGGVPFTTAQQVSRAQAQALLTQAGILNPAQAAPLPPPTARPPGVGLLPGASPDTTPRLLAPRGIGGAAPNAPDPAMADVLTRAREPQPAAPAPSAPGSAVAPAPAPPAGAGAPVPPATPGAPQVVTVGSDAPATGTASPGGAPVVGTPAMLPQAPTTPAGTPMVDLARLTRRAQMLMQIPNASAQGTALLQHVLGAGGPGTQLLSDGTAAPIPGGIADPAYKLRSQYAETLGENEAAFPYRLAEKNAEQIGASRFDTFTYRDPATGRTYTLPKTWLLGSQPGMPGATGPGGMPGIPAGLDLTPEQRNRSEALGEREKEHVAAVGKVNEVRDRLTVMRNAAEQFRTGATGEARLAGLRGLTDIMEAAGIKVPQWMRDGAAGGEVIGKEGGFLAAEMTRMLGSREAASVFQQVRNMNPNISMSQGGFDAIIESIWQGTERTMDREGFRTLWLADPRHGGSTEGMDAAFDKAFPPEVYASRVIPYKVRTPDQAAKLPKGVTMEMPDGSRKINR